MLLRRVRFKSSFFKECFDMMLSPLFFLSFSKSMLSFIYLFLFSRLVRLALSGTFQTEVYSKEEENLGKGRLETNAKLMLISDWGFVSFSLVFYFQRYLHTSQNLIAGATCLKSNSWVLNCTVASCLEIALLQLLHCTVIS